MKKKNVLWHIFCLRFTLLNSPNGGIGIEKKLLNVSSIIFMNSTWERKKTSWRIVEGSE